jgi:ammonium transporter, Amt family
VALGVAGGAVCYVAVMIVKRGMKVDDALDVLGVHGVGGALGSLLVPFAAGLGIGGVPLARPMLDQFLVQGQAVVAVGIWSLAATYLIIKLVKLAAGWRIGHDAEIQGLDFSSHGETGYNMNG